MSHGTFQGCRSVGPEAKLTKVVTLVSKKICLILNKRDKGQGIKDKDRRQRMREKEYLSGTASGQREADVAHGQTAVYNGKEGNPCQDKVFYFDWACQLGQPKRAFDGWTLDIGSQPQRRKWPNKGIDGFQQGRGNVGEGQGPSEALPAMLELATVPSFSIL